MESNWNSLAGVSCPEAEGEEEERMSEVAEGVWEVGVEMHPCAVCDLGTVLLELLPAEEAMLEGPSPPPGWSGVAAGGGRIRIVTLKEDIEVEIGGGGV